MTIPVLATVPELRATCDEIRARGRSLAVVPTMGGLHRGHLSLIERGLEVCDRVIVTIFVNPTQFAPHEDFDAYPRTLEHDVANCEMAGACAVFAPTTDEMYPPGDCTRVHVEGLSRYLCGHSRPHHFQGVATVVTKIFAAVGPCRGVFGKKDYQQLKIVQRLVTDLLLPVSIVPATTFRDENGVAMSSRNQYLNAGERVRARALVEGLSGAARAFQRGVRSAGELRDLVVRSVAKAELELDYASVANAETLEPFDDGQHVEDRALLAVAAKVGSTRLIDNLVLGEDADPLGANAAS